MADTYIYASQQAEQRKTWRASQWQWLFLPLLLLINMSIRPESAQASAPQDSSGYVITLDPQSATFVYGENGFTMTATMTFSGTKPPPNYSINFLLQVDGKPYGGSANLTGNTITLITSGLTTDLVPGNHTAIATYRDYTTNTTYQSNAETLTISKMNPALSCDIEHLSYVYSPGQTLKVDMSFANTNAPVDWQNGTYTITFTGPTTVTVSNLVPDSNDDVTVQTPTQIGNYQMSCVFNGSTLANSATWRQPIVDSAKHALGSVQLFTYPTTIQTGQPADYYVIFHPAPGLPMPNGMFSMRIGQSFTKFVQIGPNGDYMIHTPTTPGLAGVTQIFIDYRGDPTYDFQTAAFPLTNPPIPGDGDGTPIPPGSQPTATATPATGVATPGQPKATATILAGAAAPGNRPNPPSTPLSSNPLLWVAIITALVSLGVGGAGAIALLRRAKITTSALLTGQVNQGDPMNDVTQPFLPTIPE